MHEHVEKRKRNHDEEQEDAAATWDSNSDGPSFYFQFGGSLSEDDERAAGGGVVSVWTPVAISQTNVRIALDAVRFRNNYERYITTRLCLHRVNLIRSRVVDDTLASFLFSVDGCESTKIAASGRCDIYYCKLATYELKVTQKTAKKDVYIVQSIFKALTQKTMSELMQPSNLDVTDDDAGGGEGDDADDSTRERATAASRGSSSSAAGHAAIAAGGGRATDKPKATRALRADTPASDSVLFETNTAGQTTQLRSSLPLVVVGAALLGSAGAAVGVTMMRKRRRHALQRRRQEHLRLYTTAPFTERQSSKS